MIKKQFTPTVPVFFKASREIFHSNNSYFVYYGFFIGLPALLLVFYIFTGQGASHEVIPGVSAWAFLCLCIFYAFVFTPALQYWAIRKSVLSTPSANQTQNYTISETGIRNHGLGVDISLGWDKITRIKVTKNFLLLFISKKSAYFIPRELLSRDEIQEIENWHKAGN